MSIAALNQVYDEVRRLAIAGSDLAANDFRLKKLIGPLEKSATKAPVFGKVANAIQEVLDSNPQNSALKLLELSSLVTAILYTQGETGAKGTLEPLKTTDLGLTVSNTSARVIKPLIEALITTGSGRLEIIRDAHKRGGFRDLRLIKHAVRAIDDPYSEIGEYIADEVLPIYGKAIYPELRTTFNPKGKGGDARRLKLMHQLDPEATRDLVTEVLDEGSKETKLAAIACLEGRTDAVDYLMEQAQSRTKEIRQAAFSSLATVDDTKVVELLIETLSGKEPELVARGVARNKNRTLAEFVVAELERQLEVLLDPSKASAPPKPKKSTKATTKKTPKKQDEVAARVERFYCFLGALAGRTDPAAEKFLHQCIAVQAQLATMKGVGYVDGESILQALSQSLLLTRSTASLQRLDAVGVDAVPALMRYVFIASCRLKTPKQVFDMYHQTFKTRPGGRTKDASSARERADAIGTVLAELADGGSVSDFTYHGYGHVELTPRDEKIELDPRWLDAALEAGDTQRMLALARPKHKKLEAQLSRLVEAELAKKQWHADYELVGVLRAMIRIEHPRLVPLFVEVMKKAGKQKHYWWARYYLVGLLPELPAAAIQPLEELIPSINQGMLDSYAENLDQLKQKHKS